MSEWKEVKLNDVCELIVDCPHSTAPDEGHGYPLIRTPNIGKGRLILDGVHRVSKDIFDTRNARAVPKPYDLIFAREATAGNVAQIQEGQEVCLGQRTVLIRPNQSIVDSSFLTYLLLAPLQQHNLVSSANGATVAHVNLPTIRNLKISIPELPLQKKLGSILASYDNLIENYQRQIKLLEEAAQRLYKEWFVDLHFPGYENTKIVDGVPEGWRRDAKLSSIADIIMGQSPKSEFYNDKKIGLPFHQGVGSYGDRFVVNNTYSSQYTRIAEKNSILFSVRAPVGRININKEKIAIGRGLASIKEKNGYQSFLFYLLKHMFFRDNIIGNGAIFASITREQLYDLNVMFPPLKLVRGFNDKAKIIDARIFNIDSQLRLLTEARDRLLPKLMSGEIEV